MKVVTLARKLGNSISYKSILKNLRNEVNNLQQKRQRVQENLTWDSEEFQDKSKWLNRTDEFFRQVNVFVNYYEGKCSCTNFLWWYKVNKQARKMMQEMLQSQEEGNLYLLVKPPKDYKAPKSRADTINDIMEALKDPLIQTVGVWWLGGGGTTLLAKQVEEQAKEEPNLFKVVIIDVAEKPSIKQVQEDIEAILDLQFNGELHVERRNRLRLRIKKEKKILIIINDVWGELNPQEFDLDEIGVPLGDEHKGCKLLLTSKNLNFIQNLMGAPMAKMFQLEVLLEEEAQSLFQKMVGGIAQDSEASSKITEIVKICEGLAPAIFAIAKVLEKKDLHALQDALMQLKEHVAPIRLCYNSLESEEHKFLLLILTFRGRRAVNKYSIYIDMWEGLLKNLDTLEAARSRCDLLISDLKAYGLLVQDENENVKINDLIWHTAYSIAQSDLKASVISTEWRLPEERLRSLRFCNMTVVSGAQVPERLQCPEMQEIILSSDDPSMQVPNSFFDETKHLKVLELTGFDCLKLPSSFSMLKNLQALSMYNCKLGDITVVGELTSLQILVLFGSRIQQLPREIGQLQKLLVLDLRDTYLQVIPSNVLSNLTSLEELYLRNSFCNWEVERSNRENKNASLEELTNLHHLTHIEELYVPEPQAWPMDLYFEKLKSYRIFIGDRWGETHNGDHGLKTLKIKLNRRLQLEDGIKRMMKNVDVLYLDELNGVQNVLSDLDSDRFPHLQSLFVQNNAEIKCIAMSSSDDHHIDAFPNLESLSLKNVSNLKYICDGPLTEKSFFKIRVIKVHKCHEMTCLFSKTMIESLPHLVDLEVSECKLIEAIVVGEERIPIHIVFPQLHSLNLQGLPELSCFYRHSDDEPVILDDHGPTLFDDKISCPNLERMVISNVSELRHVFKYNVQNSFWNLKSVYIEDCENLMAVFTPLLFTNLQYLKILVIKNCSSVRQIFGLHYSKIGKSSNMRLICLALLRLPELRFICREIDSEDAVIGFPEMVKMHLEDLPSLWGFINEGYVELSSLENVVVNQCPKIFDFG
ncbi:probable disease resistance protein At4g27220 [Abrus precatorius]|uniref:Probable disease resistance protein At4g27220 n=1 Tax=Abrus precatorius TaxID=3816 RepID=A0A8B8KCS1_ABRPR|nr:probable disease resistance protein At4g27220 [Abrus precatorius]